MRAEALGQQVHTLGSVAVQLKHTTHSLQADSQLVPPPPAARQLAPPTHISTSQLSFIQQTPQNPAVVGKVRGHRGHLAPPLLRLKFIFQRCFSSFSQKLQIQQVSAAGGNKNPTAGKMFNDSECLKPSEHTETFTNVRKCQPLTLTGRNSSSAMIP